MRDRESPSDGTSPPTQTLSTRWAEWFPPSIRIALVLATLFVALTVALTAQYSRYRVRTTAAQVRSVMRSMAAAIESYSVDNAWFPPHTAVRDLMIKGDRLPGDVPFGTTFRRYTDQSQPMSLTTPIAYLGGSPLDPFALPLSAPFRYYATLDHVGWILASFGPDANWREGGDIEFDDAAIAAVYAPSAASPSSTLLTGAGRRGAYTYDPTNGLFSEGDVWRIKQ